MEWGSVSPFDQNLLDLNAIHEYARDSWIEAEANLHPERLGARQRQRACVLDHGSDVFDPLLGLAPCDKVAQPPNDLPGPQRLFGRLAHDFPDLAVDRVSVLPEQTAGRVCQRVGKVDSAIRSRMHRRNSSGSESCSTHGMKTRLVRP
jgi:hypothetical protein